MINEATTEKIFIIDGLNIHNIDEFYDEVERVFTADLGFAIGRNLMHSMIYFEADLACTIMRSLY